MRGVSWESYAKKYPHSVIMLAGVFLVEGELRNLLEQAFYVGGHKA